MRVLLATVAILLAGHTPVMAKQPPRKPTLLDMLKDEPRTTPEFDPVKIQNVQVTDYMSDGTTLQSMWKEEKRPARPMRRR